MKKETRERRMWNKLLRADLNCGWRNEDGFCLLRSHTDENGIWRRRKCSLPCANLDTGIMLKQLEDLQNKKVRS